ncbi:MAG: hypothetical protein FWE40_09580 [Oscillospiraceae bacterium]|nr:hypothetical protein [Oscillospiraceae bacterium]
MKRNVKRHRLPIRLITLILAIAVAWTVPWAVSTITMARYTTQATVSFSARVAAWDPIWLPVTGSAAAAPVGGLASLDSGVVIRPGNWTNTNTVYWRLENHSEVVLETYITPMAITGQPNTLQRTQLQASHFPGGSLDLTNATNMRTVWVGNSTTSFFSFAGYTAANAPQQPTASVNSGTVTLEAPIRFGVGSHTYDLNHRADSGILIWRTLRINADGIAQQVD